MPFSHRPQGEAHEGDDQQDQVDQPGGRAAKAGHAEAARAGHGKPGQRQRQGGESDGIQQKPAIAKRIAQFLLNKDENIFKVHRYYSTEKSSTLIPDSCSTRSTLPLLPGAAWTRMPRPLRLTGMPNPSSVCNAGSMPSSGK